MWSKKLVSQLPSSLSDCDWYGGPLNPRFRVLQSEAWKSRKSNFHGWIISSPAAEEWIPTENLNHWLLTEEIWFIILVYHKNILELMMMTGCFMYYFSATMSLDIIRYNSTAVSYLCQCPTSIFYACTHNIIFVSTHALQRTLPHVPATT